MKFYNKLFLVKTVLKFIFKKLYFNIFIQKMPRNKCAARNHEKNFFLMLFKKHKIVYD